MFFTSYCFVEDLQRKPVLAFFKVCPSADVTSGKKFKKIMKALKRFDIDEAVVSKVIKFTGKSIWIIPPKPSLSHLEYLLS